MSRGLEKMSPWVPGSNSLEHEGSSFHLSWWRYLCIYFLLARDTWKVWRNMKKICERLWDLEKFRVHPIYVGSETYKRGAPNEYLSSHIGPGTWWPFWFEWWFYTLSFSMPVLKLVQFLRELPKSTPINELCEIGKIWNMIFIFWLF